MSKQQYTYKIEISKSEEIVLMFIASYNLKRGKNGKRENRIVLENLIKNDIEDGDYKVSFMSNTLAYMKLRRTYQLKLTTIRGYKNLKYLLTFSDKGKASLLNDKGIIKEPIIRSLIPPSIPPPILLIPQIPLISLPPFPFPQSISLPPLISTPPTPLISIPSIVIPDSHELT